VQDDDGAWSTPDTVRVTVVGPPPAPPTPGVTEIPQWVTPKITYSAPFNAASRVIRLIRSGGTGTGTGGDALPYTLPFVLGAASASGDSALVRKVFSGPGAAASFSVGGAGTIITIERSEDGVVGVPVRGATGVSPENGELEIIDGEATPQKLHYWRARATDVTEGVIRTSAWSEWVELTPDPILPSVKDPTDPEATILLTVLDFGGESSSRLATEHQTFGQEAPVVVANGWTSSRGTCTVLVDSKLQREMLRTLIRSEAKLLLQRPTEDGLEEGEQWYIEPLGELPVARLTAQKYAGRTIAFSWREVAKP
jgi:hypothetical protein